MNMIGIDPGLLGGIVVVDEDGKIIQAEPMPVITKGVYDYHGILSLFTLYKGIATIAIENVGFMGVATASGITDLCYHAGVIYGLAIAVGLPVTLAYPAVWKKQIGLPKIGTKRGTKEESDQEKKKRTSSNYRARRIAKQQSIEYAIRLMPDLAKFGKITDGIAEAALIAKYEQNRNKGDKNAKG